MTSCVSPGDWGTAAVAVLFKTGDPLDWTNYRLISLLSIISKLFEAILNRRLTNMLNVHDLLHSCQIGCRGPGYRCQEHSFVLSETIKFMARRRKKTFCAFLDVRKAYPTVLRVGLMEKLHQKISSAPGGNLEFRSHFWSVIDNLYECCASKIVIQDVASEEYNVKHGLREGSCLSPTLYAIFLDAIVDRIIDCKGVSIGNLKIKIMLYVDDIVLLSESPEDLQCMLNCCQEYADDHSFQFSFQKSQVVVFGDDVDYPHEWTFMEKTMTQSPYYKYLGMIFRRSLGSFGSVLPGAADRRKYVGMKFIDDSPLSRQIRSDGVLPPECNKCCVCKKSTTLDDYDQTALEDVVLCDHCDAETHLRCSELSSIPEGEFFLP